MPDSATESYPPRPSHIPFNECAMWWRENATVECEVCTCARNVHKLLLSTDETGTMKSEELECTVCTCTKFVGPAIPDFVPEELTV